MQPKQSSSRVQSRWFSIAGGFMRPFELEKMMGLVVLERECAKAADVVASLWLRLLEREALVRVWLLRPRLRFRDRRDRPTIVSSSSSSSSSW